MNLQIRPIPELQSWASVRGNGLLLANGLGVKPPTVSDWVTGKKRIPLDKVMPIERITEGAVARRHMRPHDYLVHWPELADTYTESLPIAIENVADAHAAIKHVEAVAVAAIRQETGQATAEIKHVVTALLAQGEAAAQPEEEPWDEVSERRKLNAPIDRRVSAESVAHAEFLRSQAAAKQQGD